MKSSQSAREIKESAKRTLNQVFIFYNVKDLGKDCCLVNKLLVDLFMFFLSSSHSSTGF